MGLVWGVKERGVVGLSVAAPSSGAWRLVAVVIPWVWSCLFPSAGVGLLGFV